jgi:ADP-ribose pyrophosphatase YjhB (NUDIX family)
MISCLFENGSKTFLRHVTVNAIIIKNNQVLLGKRGMFKGRAMLEINKWALIGGFLERDETLVEAVKREVKEESGLTITAVKLFRINDRSNRPKEDRQNVDFIFLAKVNQGPLKQGYEEIKELRWFSLDNLPPKEELAFDHVESLNLYRQYRREKFSLPVLG